METAKEIAPARQEKQTRGTDVRPPSGYKDTKQVAAADKSDAPTWDEV